MRNQMLVLSALLVLGPANALGQVIESVAGANAATITPFRDAFRGDLGGGTVGSANGLFTDGTGARREINWDGVGAPFSAPNGLPANFFNSNSPRGAVFSTPGTGFEVSGATTDLGAGQPAAADFGNIDATYTNTFGEFSEQRLFTELGSNILDVSFFVPGTSVPALTRGFGAVFTDVDLPNLTSLQLFGAGNASLGTFFVPAVVGNETLSFLGVSFLDPVISRVRITTGNTALGAGVSDQNGNTRDLVVMDDFIYGEPVRAASVPLPATLWLMAAVLPLLALSRRRGR